MLSYAGSRRMISVILVFSPKNIRARANNREKCSLLPTVFITWLAEPRHQIQYTEACSKSRKCTLALMASANRLASIFFFFARAAIVSAGQNIIFRDNKRYKQRLDPPFPKRRQFSDLFSRAGVLKREKNNGKGDSASEPSRFASLSEGEMQQILTERHSGKTKQKTNWSVSTFKGKRKLLRFEIVKFKTRALNIKIKNKTNSHCANSLTANKHF